MRKDAKNSKENPRMALHLRRCSGIMKLPQTGRLPERGSL